VVAIAATRDPGRVNAMPRIPRGILFVLPTVVFLGAFIAYPLVATAVLSVTDGRGAFVGGANFAEAITGRVTRIALQNTVVYVGASMVLQMLAGTFAGIVLDQPFRGRSVLRAIILIPWIVPGVVAATTWAWMFHTEFGIINYLLIQLGLIEQSIGWLVRADTVMPALIAVNTWKMYPFVAVMVLAGLQGIPASLYEAARVDGATFWDEVRLSPSRSCGRCSARSCSC
jgi:multiple sugar transport system permease protein